jgi:hypothetical protein
MKRALLLAAAVVAVMCMVAAQDSPGPSRGYRPVGTWEQTSGDTRITLTITPDRLHVAALGKDNKPLWLMDADYSVTKDSILFGIVTSTEGEKKAGGAANPEPVVEPVDPPNPRARGLQPSRTPVAKVPQLALNVDDLFSFRFRVDDDILTIKEAKAKVAGGRGEFVLQGRFKKKADPREDIFKRKDKDFDNKGFDKADYKDKADRFRGYKDKK